LARVSVGLIGLGVHGSRYAAHLLSGEVPDARLVAISRRDAESGLRFARSNGLSFYADYRELAAAPEVDSVAIVTPCPAHAAMIRAVLEEGKPVLVEKPVVSSSEEALLLARELPSVLDRVMVAHTLRFNGVVRYIKENRSLVGRAFRLRMGFRLPSQRLYWESERDGPPRGTILETGVHLFDAARWVAGEDPARLVCTSASIMSRGVEDFFSAEMEFSAMRAQLEVAKCSSARVESVELSGDQAQLSGEARRNRLEVYRAGGAERIDLGPPVHTVREVLSEFVSCILQDAPFSIPFEEGARAVRIAEACFESARLGAYVEVKMPQWGDAR